MKRSNEYRTCIRCGENGFDEYECPACGEDSCLTGEEMADLLNEIYLNTNKNESFKTWLKRMNDGE